MFVFDIRGLVRDLGGAAAVARSLGVSRTTPYRWMRTGYLSSVMMERLKDAHPSVSFDRYFISQ